MALIHTKFNLYNRPVANNAESNAARVSLTKGLFRKTFKTAEMQSKVYWFWFNRHWNGAVFDQESVYYALPVTARIVRFRSAVGRSTGQDYIMYAHGFCPLSYNNDSYKMETKLATVIIVLCSVVSKDTLSILNLALCV